MQMPLVNLQKQYLGSLGQGSCTVIGIRFAHSKFQFLRKICSAACNALQFWLPQGLSGGGSLLHLQDYNGHRYAINQTIIKLLCVLTILCRRTRMGNKNYTCLDNASG